MTYSRLVHSGGVNNVMVSVQMTLRESSGKLDRISQQKGQTCGTSLDYLDTNKENVQWSYSRYKHQHNWD